MYSSGDSDDDSDLSGFGGWLKTVSRLVSSNASGITDAFDQATKKLQSADVFKLAQPGEYRVPVSLRVKLTQPEDGDAFVSTLETIVASLSPVFELAHVDVDVSSLERVADETLLKQVQGVGVVVRTFTSAKAVVGDGDIVRSFKLAGRCGSVTSELCAALARGIRDISLRIPPGEIPDWILLHHTASSSPSVRHLQVLLPNVLSERKGKLARSLLTAKGSQAIASVRVRTQAVDAPGLLEVLTERSMDVTATYSAILGNDNALLQIPQDKDVVLVPMSSLEVIPTDTTASSGDKGQQAGQPVRVDVSMGLCPPQRASKLLEFLQSCFAARPISFSLHVVTDATFTDDGIASILATHPTMRCVKLCRADLKTMDVFASAYRTQRCRIRVLSIDCGSAGFIPFLEELGSPSSVVAIALQELTIGFPQYEDDEGEAAYLRAIETMLEHNTRLQFFGLYVKKPSSALITKIVSTLQRFHRTPLAVATSRPMPLRAKLAFIGAVAPPHAARSEKRPRTAVGSPRVTPSLSLEPMRNILAFAAPCMLRIVELTHETSHRLGVVKTQGRVPRVFETSRCYREIAKDLVVSLASERDSVT